MSIITEAYVARPNNQIKLEKVQYASLDDNEVLVEIVAGSICHSDVRAAAGTFMTKLPIVFGHEAGGYVKRVGSGVVYVKPGDAVVLAYASCGKCRRCLKGQQPYCVATWELNFTGRRVNGDAAITDEHGEALNGLFFGQSSMSRLALVREESCVKVECSREELVLFASLACGMQTGAGAILNVAKPSPGSSIAVFGGGAVGLSAILEAKLCNPACLILVDNSQAKLDMIPKALLDGVRTVNSANKSPEEVAAELVNLSPSRVGMDVALDCVGNEAVVLAAHAALDKLGMLVIVGSSATARAQFMLNRHILKGGTVRGTHQGDSVPRIMIPRLIELWRRGWFPFDQLLTHFKFEDLQKALDETHEGKVVKPLLVL